MRSSHPHPHPTTAPLPGTPPLTAASLTGREREILTLIARGWSNGDIAESLSITPSTVKSHITRLFAKLRIRDRARAVIVADESGLVVPGG